MSRTTASTLDNRIVTFVDINDEYNCVICMQVADDPVRCSRLCAGIFCNGCMQQALRGKKTCPSCKMNNITAPKDVLLRNQIMKHQVYCVNNGTMKASNPKQMPDPDEKCGKYDQLAAHLNQCDYEIISCVSEGCDSKIERCKLAEHLQVCPHRIEKCDHCSIVIKAAAMLNHLLQCPKVVVSCECDFECARDALTAHRDKDCPLVEICCDVIGCDVKMKRGDYEKHQEQSASHHVCLLSAALVRGLKAADNEINLVKEKNDRLKAEIDSTKQENVTLSSDVQKLVLAAAAHSSFQIKWRITDIAAKKQRGGKIDSPRFDVFFRGGHKFYIQAEIRGSRLGLYLCKDEQMSEDCIYVRMDEDISFTVTKDGLPVRKAVIRYDSFSPHNRVSINDMRPYFDNDSINVVLDLKVNKDNNSIVL